MVPAAVTSALYMVMIVLALKAAGRLPHRHTGLWPAVGVWVVVAIPSLLQFAFPAIYDALHRDSALIIDGHQWWRPYTSFMVQDGGAAGTAFNLITLAIVAAAAVRVWGPAASIGILAGSVVLYSIPALLRPMPPGGGNSGITFTLAASLAGLALVATPGRRAAVITAAMIADGVVTLVLGDMHGVPMITGVAIGVAIAAARRHRERRAAPANTETSDPALRGAAQPG